MLGSFDIHEPETVEEASQLLTEHGLDAALYAGGTELLVLMKERLVHFPYLVNIKTIPGLDGISFDAETRALDVGPLVTHRVLERSELVREHAPEIAAMEARVANVRVRAAGTIGGNLCFAEPHSDPATLLIAWGATFTLTSAAGSRDVRAEDFFTGLLETARRHEELLTGIRIPLLPAGAGIAYERFKTHERPTATAAAMLHLMDGVISEARVVAGSVGPRPERIAAAEMLLRGQSPSPDLFAAVARAAHDAVDPTEDAFESTDYKRHLIRVLTTRALATAAGRAADAKGAGDGR
jgi:carbon-monoxide dehydrogenase medium subunit